MNINIVYAITAFVNMIQIMMILNRVRTTEYQETIDRPLCKMLTFFILFCGVDCLWGFFDAGMIISKPGYTVMLYCYHLVVALSAFLWFYYALTYIGVKGKARRLLNGIRWFLLGVQVIALCYNPVSHACFWVDASGTFHKGNFGGALYLSQYAYYVILLLYGLYGWKKYRRERKTYQEVMMFSMILLIFGVAQYVFFDVAMYSFGFALTSLAIFSFNTTVAREYYLKKKAEKLQEDVYRDALTGLLNRKAYEVDIKSICEQHDSRKRVYMSMDLNGLKEVNDCQGHEAGDTYLKNATAFMKNTLGEYGKIYRTGGDEFVAILLAEEADMKSIEEDFDRMINSWDVITGQKLSISYGYASVEEFPEFTPLELIDKADKRMYEKKAEFYKNKKEDRRRNRE